MRLRRNLMQTLTIAAGLGVGLIAAGPAALAHPVRHSGRTVAPRNLPDSFLPASADSLHGLLVQVQTNPIVCKRYAKYFHLPESRVAAYLQANLTQKRLHQTGRYTVFMVRPNGLIYPTMLTVPKGSAVFALRGGDPVLTGRDGDPMRQYRTAQEIHIIKERPRPTVIVAGTEEVIVPNQVSETVVPTIEQTPVYQPTPIDTETPAEAGPTSAATTSGK